MNKDLILLLREAIKEHGVPDTLRHLSQSVGELYFDYEERDSINEDTVDDIMGNIDATASNVSFIIMKNK